MVGPLVEGPFGDDVNNNGVEGAKVLEKVTAPVSIFSAATRLAMFNAPVLFMISASPEAGVLTGSSVGKYVFTKTISNIDILCGIDEGSKSMRLLGHKLWVLEDVTDVVLRWCLSLCTSYRPYSQI